METDSDGKRELIKAGVKMKAEGEMGYEPSLLMEMQRLAKADAVTADPKTHGWNHRMIVLKDRSQQVNGRVTDFPGDAPDSGLVFNAIEPHLRYLNISGTQMGVDTTRTSEELFEGPSSRSERAKQVEIVLEEIGDAFVEGGFGGTSTVAKETKVRLLKKVFGTSSWTAISGQKLEDLQAGLLRLRVDIETEIRKEEGVGA